MIHPPVTIIILTRDRRERLFRGLEVLVPQLAAGDEILVLDTGSADGTREALRTAPPPGVRLLELDSPGSWAEVRNRGVREARGEWIAFLDDDCLPAPDWMERGRNALAAGAGAAGGLLLPPPGIEWPSWWDAHLNWLAGVSVPGHLGPEAGRYFYPYTANLWARAEALRRLPFQELGGEFGGEDAGRRYQLGREDAQWWRAFRIHGGRAVFDPRIRAAHWFDPARLSMEYITGRAAADGAAWARREGRAEDLPELAYRRWSLLFGSPLGAAEESWPEGSEELGTPPSPASRAARRLLAQVREESALNELALRLSGPVHPENPTAFRLKNRALASAGFRYARDRAKTAVRRIVLSFAPPMEETEARRRWESVRARPERPKLAVFASAFAGDLVILQGVLRGAAALNGAEIYLIAPPAAAEIFRGVEDIRLHTLPAGLDSPAGAEEILTGILDGIRPGGIAAPYLHGAAGAGLVRLLHRRRRIAPALVAFDRDEGLDRELDRARIPWRIPKDLTIPERDNLLRLFAAMGFEVPAPPPPRMTPDPEHVSAARERLAERGWTPEGEGRLLVLNPDAGKAFKEWRDEGWAGLAAGLAARGPFRFLVNLSRPRPALEAAFAARGVDPDRVLWLRNEPLAGLAAFMSLASGIITVDAGPQHFARALDLPSLTFYGPMDERRWAVPSGGIHATARGCMFDLTPEELRGLPENHIASMLSNEAALEAALAWLKGI